MPAIQAPRVLIAEEERVTADLLSLTLEELGCQVKVTSQEAKIRDGIVQWKPDLVLLDLFLPGCSGLGLLREFHILSAGMGKKMPIMVISSLGFREVVQQAREQGAVDFILKPIDVENFRQKALMYLP